MSPRERRIEILQHQLKPVPEGNYDFKPKARSAMEAQLKALQSGKSLGDALRIFVAHLKS